MEFYPKLKIALDDYIAKYPSTTNIKFVEDFLDVNKKKKERPNRISLIKLIINLEIKELEDAKSILESCSYPFDYDNPLYDLYDEGLKLFIKNDIYDGELQNIYQYEIEKEYITDNQEKYENVLKNIIFSAYYDIEEFDSSENFIYNLHLKIDRYQDSKENIYDIVYPQCKEMQLLRSYISEYEEASSTYPLSMEEFINIMLITYIDNYYEKRIKQFRRVIEDIQQSVFKKIFMDQLYLNEPFSYDRFNDFYKYLFLRNDIEKRELVLINLLTKILTSINKIYFSTYFSIQDLSTNEIKESLLKIKHEIDSKMLK